MPHALPNLDPRVEDNAVVHLRYALFDCDEEELVESGEISYRHGGGDLFPAVEAALVGLPAGATTEIRLSPEQSFGRRVDGLIVTLPSEELAHHHQHVGATVRGITEDGHVGDFLVTRVDDGRVTLDANHPLAGATLRIVVRVLDVQPTAATSQRSGTQKARRRPKISTRQRGAPRSASLLGH